MENTALPGETRTWEIIDDVKNSRSEVGVLFLNSYNRDVLSKMLEMIITLVPPTSLQRNLMSLSARAVSCQEEIVHLSWSGDFPYSYDQTHNSFCFFQKRSSRKEHHKKSIVVSDRQPSLISWLVDGYTIARPGSRPAISTVITSSPFPLISIDRAGLHQTWKKQPSQKWEKKFIEYLLEEWSLISKKIWVIHVLLRYFLLILLMKNTWPISLYNAYLVGYWFYWW